MDPLSSIMGILQQVETLLADAEKMASQASGAGELGNLLSQASQATSGALGAIGGGQQQSGGVGGILKEVLPIASEVLPLLAAL